MKKKNNTSVAVALGGGEKTARVVAEAEQLVESVRRLGVPMDKPKYRLKPPLGTVLDRASRYRAV